MFEVGEREQPTRKRKVRSDKKIHVNPALPQDVHHKLQRLAIACETTKTELAQFILTVALDSPSMINFLQEQYGADEFRVYPMRNNGKIEF